MAMAGNKIFLISSLLILAIFTQKIHAVDFLFHDFTDERWASGRFYREIGKEFSLKTLAEATSFIWEKFEQNSPADRKNLYRIILLLEQMYGIDFPARIDNQNWPVSVISLNAVYVHFYSGADIKRDIAGVLYLECARILQWDGNGQAPRGLVDGIAIFIKRRRFFEFHDWVRPGQGDRWDEGGGVTALFLEYIESSVPKGFVARLNKKMREWYSDRFFVELTGKSVDQLWKQYKAHYARRSDIALT